MMVNIRPYTQPRERLWSGTRAQRLAQVGLAAMVGACSTDPGPIEQTNVTTLPIYSGAPSAPGTRPSAAYVAITAADEKLYACSSTVIAPEWVLTAKHCTDDPAYNIVPTPSLFQVIVGRQDLTSTDGEEVAVVDIVPHPGDDLALLHLQHAVTVPVSRVLSPARAFEVPYGSSVVMAGWGHYNDFIGGLSSVLRECAPKLLGQGADCYQVPVGEGWQISRPLSAHHVCLGGDPYICMIGEGDSGGPTWVQRDGEWFLAAVHADAPNAFSEDVWVPAFFDWLLQNAPGQKPSYLSSAQIMAILL